jgi:hypothetical protein
VAVQVQDLASLDNRDEEIGHLYQCLLVDLSVSSIHLHLPIYVSSRFR